MSIPILPCALFPRLPVLSSAISRGSQDIRAYPRSKNSCSEIFEQPIWTLVSAIHWALFDSDFCSTWAVRFGPGSHRNPSILIGRVLRTLPSFGDKHVEKVHHAQCGVCQDSLYNLFVLSIELRRFCVWGHLSIFSGIRGPLGLSLIAQRRQSATILVYWFSPRLISARSEAAIWVNGSSYREHPFHCSVLIR